MQNNNYLNSEYAYEEFKSNTNIKKFNQLEFVNKTSQATIDAMISSNIGSNFDTFSYVGGVAGIIISNNGIVSESSSESVEKYRSDATSNKTNDEYIEDIKVSGNIRLVGENTGGVFGLVGENTRVKNVGFIAYSPETLNREENYYQFNF